MRDVARVYTDRELHKLTKELERVYSRALSDVKKTWDELARQYKPKADALFKAIEDAKKLGDAELIKSAQATYYRYLNSTLTPLNSQYQATLNDISARLANIDREAYRMANGMLPDVYAHNYNSLKAPKGYVLKIVDKNTVKNLAVKDIQLLKDTRWNIKRLNAEILQGIMNGDSMNRIAKRLEPFVGGNKAAAIRNARTAVTSAENAGRLDSMRDAETELGLIYKKQWIATHDDRTRDSHAEIDGEIVDLDELFSNGCEYPGDPKGEPGEVFNCRCTMNRVLWGIIQADGRVKRV